MKEMLRKIREFVNRMNTLGIPFPLARDPKTKKASVSFTLVVLSSFYVQLSLVNMFASWFKGIDVINSLYWAGMCYALYFGRSFDKLGESKAKDDKEGIDSGREKGDDTGAI